MDSKIAAYIKMPASDFRQFKKEYKNLFWWLGFFVVFTYGNRIIHDNIFLDSEIMILRPDFMQNVWIGSNRFGLTFTSRLFGMSRLIPYISCFLSAVLIWANALALSFAVYGWCSKSRRYKIFLYLFPALFTTAPVFAEQYHFVLQAFEISFAILLCILSVICITRVVYQKERIWLIPGIPLMVWAFGSYQSIVPLYICLVLLSFLLFYMNQDSRYALSQGIAHVIIFIAGAALYGIMAAVIKSVLDIHSGYISSLVRWGTDDWKTCVLGIWEELKCVLLARKPVFYSRLYLPCMCLVVLQAMWYGWKRKTKGTDYFCFLLAGGLFLISPFFLTVILGCMQQTRSQLVYPVTAACFLSHLTVLPPEETGKKWKKGLAGLFAAVGLFALSRNALTTAQLFQTAWEAYRNDVMTAARIYEDIRLVADRPDMSNCLVIFTGGRGARFGGPVVTGDLIGMSLFGAEAHTPAGVSGRVDSLFVILGLELKIMTAEQEDLYRQAIEYMRDAPDWPAQGSVRKMGDIVVVRLSQSP